MGAQDHSWWLASRASGITALVLVTISVTIGLSMAGGWDMRRPGLKRALMAVHEHAAVGGILAIAVHAITLLGDSFLRPSITDVALPFAMDYRPLATGMGVIAAWLAILLGLSFYARRRIGAARWRKLHRLTLLVYLLAAAHTLSAGSDAGNPLLLAITLMPAGVIATLAARRFAAASGPGAESAGRG
jgi:sulfoxide reductase heme-binding subunit YedZ